MSDDRDPITKAVEDSEPTVVLCDGKAVAVILPIDFYDDLMEALGDEPT